MTINKVIERLQQFKDAGYGEAELNFWRSPGDRIEIDERAFKGEIERQMTLDKKMASIEINHLNAL